MDATDQAMYAREAVRDVYDLPLMSLMQHAARVHTAHHKPHAMQRSALLSIKTGACPEDCAYCPQSAHHATDVEPEALMSLPDVVAAAQRAKAQGADRFCLGAAWRDVTQGPDFERVLEMVSAVKGLGLETCATLGMVDADAAKRLKDAGLDYYNHNLDSSPEFYETIISTRTYDERRDTLAAVRQAGLHVCCGGIVGMGETDADRIGLLHELANLDPQPESVPINALIAVEGTPLEGQPQVAWDVLVRTIATARILMPTTVIRLSAGRSQLSEAEQALCFLVGANSVFLGERLLTAPNPGPAADEPLLEKLGFGTCSDA